MCSVVVDKANNARDEVANKPLKLTKYRVKKASSCPCSPPCGKGSGGKSRSNCPAEEVVLVEDHSPQAQLEVHPPSSCSGFFLGGSVCSAPRDLFLWSCTLIWHSFHGVIFLCVMRRSFGLMSCAVATGLRWPHDLLFLLYFVIAGAVGDGHVMSSVVLQLCALLRGYLLTRELSLQQKDGRGFANKIPTGAGMRKTRGT